MSAPPRTLPLQCRVFRRRACTGNGTTASLYAFGVEPACAIPAPVAVINGQLADVLSSGPGHLTIRLDPEHPLRHENQVVVTFDPYAVVKVM
jgi:hypothetical protein